MNVCMNIFVPHLKPEIYKTENEAMQWNLSRKMYSHSLAPLISRFESSGFFLLGICKGHCLLWKSAECEWVAWYDHQRCRVHYQWNTCQQLARKWVLAWCIMPLGVHIETYCAYKELCEIQCSKMYQFLQ